MALTPCDPCECEPGLIENDKFKSDVVNILCQTLTALGYVFPGADCNPCLCIPGNIPNDTFKQQVEILLCLILDNIGGGGGGGTVTSFSFTDANGVSGVVTNPTTTPNLTLSIDDGSITFAKIQDVNSGILLGRATAGPGSVEEITLGPGLAFTGTSLDVTANAGLTIGQVLALSGGHTLQ